LDKDRQRPDRNRLRPRQELADVDPAERCARRCATSLAPPLANSLSFCGLRCRGRRIHFERQEYGQYCRERQRPRHFEPDTRFWISTGDRKPRGGCSHLLPQEQSSRCTHLPLVALSLLDPLIASLIALHPVPSQDGRKIGSLKSLITKFAGKSPDGPPVILNSSHLGCLTPFTSDAIEFVTPNKYECGLSMSVCAAGVCTDS
jgi:hypothetical protein